MILDSWEPGIYTAVVTKATGEEAGRRTFALVPLRVDSSADGPIAFGLDGYYPPEWPAALGLRHYRMSWPWRGLKPGAEVGEYQWEGSMMARYAELVGENDLSALAIVWAPPRNEADFLGNYHKSRNWPRALREEKYWAFPPADITGWEEYISLILDHTADLPLTLEVWNEPNASFFGGDMDDYARLVSVTARVVKAKRPEVIVAGGGSFTPKDMEFYRTLASLGVYDDLDVVTVHTYSYGGPKVEQEHYRQLIKLSQELLSLGFDRPLWVTEMGGYTAPRLQPESPLTEGILDSLLAAPEGTIIGGFPQKEGRYPWKPMTEAETAAYLVRASVLALAAGVERIYFHRWWAATGRTAKAHRLWDWETGTAQLQTVAIEVLNYWLGGARLDRAAVSDDVVDIRFRKGKAVICLAWSYSGKGELALRPDELDWIAYDTDGRRLNSAALSKEDHIRLSPYPIYLVGMKQGPSLE